MEKEWPLKDAMGSNYWLVLGRYGRWWNLALDVTDIRGQRSIYGSQDVADYKTLFEELRGIPVNYTPEAYHMVSELGEIRNVELAMIEAVQKDDSLPEERKRYLLGEIEKATAAKRGTIK